MANGLWTVLRSEYLNNTIIPLKDQKIMRMAI